MPDVLDERTVNVESNRSEGTNPGEWWRQVRGDLDQRMEALMVARLQPLRQEMQQFQSLLQGLEERIERASQPVWQEMEEAWRSMEGAFTSAREKQAEAHRTELGAAVESAVEEERKVAQARLAETEERLRSSREVLGRTLRSLEEGSRQPDLPKAAEGKEGSKVELDSIQRAIESISLQSSQQEALLQLIDQVTRYAPRSIFFVVRAGNVIGWRVRGFENGLTDGTVASLRGSVEIGSILGEALRTQRAVAVDHPSTDQMEMVLGAYASPIPTRAVALPLVVREKAVAVLYVDAATPETEERIDQGAIELLLRVASLVIELLSIRKQLVPAAPKSSIPAPPERLPAESSRIEESVATPAVTAEPTPPIDRVETASPEMAVLATSLSSEVPKKREDLSSVPSEGTPAWVAEAPATIEPPDQSDESARDNQENQDNYDNQDIRAEPDGEIEKAETAVEDESAARDKASPPPFSMSPEMGRITREIPAGEIPFFTDEPTETEKSDEEVRVRFPFAPSQASTRNETDSWDRGRSPGMEPVPVLNRPLVEPMAGSSPATDETEQRAHNDARRFARLLVSEIKLYNASKVQEGRRNLDLYERLAEEIDRSRQVYDKRVSPEVAMEIDYYHEELVQTLAEGDPAKLGVSYPGPALR